MARSRKPTTPRELVNAPRAGDLSHGRAGEEPSGQLALTPAGATWHHDRSWLRRSVGARLLSYGKQSRGWLRVHSPSWVQEQAAGGRPSLPRAARGHTGLRALGFPDFRLCDPPRARRPHYPPGPTLHPPGHPRALRPHSQARQPRAFGKGAGFLLPPRALRGRRGAHVPAGGAGVAEQGLHEGEDAAAGQVPGLQKT